MHFNESRILHLAGPSLEEVKENNLEETHVVCISHTAKHPYTINGRDFISLEHYEAGTLVVGNVAKGKFMLLFFTLG